MDNKSKDYLEAGVIAGLHSFRGQVKIKHDCDSPEFLLQFKKLYLDAEGRNELTVKSMSVHKNMLLTSFEGIDDEPAAMRLKGKTVYIDKKNAALDEDSYFISDIIGIAVADNDNGTQYGILKDVLKLPANDIYVVETPDGREVLIPGVSAFVKRTVPGEALYISPISGMFD